MDTWYLRSTVGKVFGPIGLDSLKAWVRDGRVEPLAGVSRDLKSWRLAPLLPELEMNWIVENNPGQFYGPTHREVIDDLMKSGQLSRDARFYQDDRGAMQERLKASEAALAAKDLELTRREVALEDSQKQLAKRDLALAAAQKAVEQRDQRISDAVATIAQKDTQIDVLAKSVKAKEGDLVQAAKDLAACKIELERLDQELAQKTEELADLRRQFDERDKVHERTWQAAEVVEPEIVDAMPPPIARQAFGHTGPSTGARGGGAANPSLADLERRAQEELARMSAAGLNVSGMFKFGKK